MFNFGGGMLTGYEISRQIKKGNISISPYDPECINPNSYNLKLHPQLLIYGDKNYLQQEYKKPENNAVNRLDENYEDLSKFCVTEELTEEIKNTSTNDIDLDNAEEFSEGSRNYSGRNNDIIVTNIVDGIKDSIKTVEECLLTESQMRLDSDNYHKDLIDDIYDLPIISSYYKEPLDMHKKNKTTQIIIPEEGYVLQPGVLYIGRTEEITWTDKFIPMINGRSSGGRLGIDIHICAGFGDIGFKGSWTLEIRVVHPVRIYPGTEIAQVCFFKPCGKVKNLYRGRYQNQIDATASKFNLPKTIYKNK